jgi:multidrug efflux pump subunit AcrA (membrane-fusion protein)
MKHAGILFLAATLMLAAGSFAGCSKEEKKAAEAVVPPTLVKVAQPRRGEIRRTIEFTGNVFAVNESMVSSKVPGRISRIFVEEGARIEAGKPLVQIDCSDLLTAFQAAQGAFEAANSALARVLAGARVEEKAQAQAGFDLAKANLEYANASFIRASELLNASAISQDQFEMARTQFDAARAQFQIAEQQHKMAKTGATKEDVAIAKAGVQSAAAALEGAKSQLNDSVVRAPFAGYVIRKLANVGEMAAPGVPLLVLADMKTVKIEFGVPEEYFGLVREKAAVGVCVDAWPDEKRSSIVTVKNPYIDPMTRSFKVRVEMPNSNKDRTLVPGMFARVELALEVKVGALIVPARAVLGDESVRYVFTVNQMNMRKVPHEKSPAPKAGADPDGDVPVFIAMKKTVIIGIVTKDEIEIISGISDGESVIIEGNYGLKDKQTVEVIK